MQIGGRQSRLPVMRMHDLRLEGRNQPLSQGGADLGQGGEAERVVGEIAPVGSGIRAAVAVEQMGRVEHEQIERAGASGQHAGGAAEQVGEFRHRLRFGQSRRARRDSRDKACASTTFSASSACGRAPATSARPPVFTSG